VISVAADVLGDLLAQGGDSATLRARGGLLIVGSDHASRGFAAKVLAGLADGGVGGGGRVTIAAPRFGAERAVAGIGAGW
jgi:hypothetical protein